MPLYPLTPILSIAGALWIISQLRPITLYVFIGWVALALVWYALYARGHSKLADHAPSLRELDGRP